MADQNDPLQNAASAGIEAVGLVREFKKGPRAVDGIDLRVEPGEIYGFLGPNGAGKSTTVLMLTTLLPPTAGSARVAGHDVVAEGPQVRAAIGAALQEAALDPQVDPVDGPRPLLELAHQADRFDPGGVRAPRRFALLGHRSLPVSRFAQ